MMFFISDRDNYSNISNIYIKRRDWEGLAPYGTVKLPPPVISLDHENVLDCKSGSGKGANNEESSQISA